MNTKFAKSLNLDYAILSDPGKKVAEAYGVLTGKQKYPSRWTYYIGKDGKVLYIDKKVKSASHGADCAKKLKELGVGERKTDPALVYELRTYTTLEGRLPALHARFRDHTLQLFDKHGIKNVMYWTPVDKKNTLVYLIAHASRKAADKSWKAFGSDPEWRKVRAASIKDGKILTSVKRQYLTPTDYSPTQSGGFNALVKDKGIVFELRTYTANEGKLDNLHARFRDHTITLFKQHGMTNLIYTTPVNEKTASNTLVYLIAHNSKADADKSWQAFRTDPQWQKAYRESIKDGKLVTKVQSQYLTPTDYSPLK